MMKKVLFSILFLTATSDFYYLNAQILSVAAGTDLVIKDGTIFSADNIVLTPSADFTLSNISLTRNATVSHPVVNTYIARVYHFTGNTNPFNGTIQINYQDGAELNGIPETDLQLNVHNGTSWQVVTSNTNDAVNNFVLSNVLPGVQLNELTLAAIGAALPLQWRSFIATKQQNNILLQWSTFSEQNTKSFILQTSTDSRVWNTMATVPAAGNSSSVRDYNYLHTSPATGYNYYRIIETDIDGKYNYSLVRKVRFDPTPWNIELLGNPVSNGLLEIKITLARLNDIPPILKLYTVDGKLLWVKRSVGGTQAINVYGYPQGTYLLQANEKTLKFLIER
ncbi:MAG: T9SS type A sorting domain-containing protein [Ginsengibacter sp.]